MAAPRPSRKQARRDAAFVLYQHDVTGKPVADLLADIEQAEGYAADGFTRRCVDGVGDRRPALDRIIVAHAQGWALERLAPLERTILRLALWEIESGVTPPEVAIDEAVRLTRRYSTDEAGAFVNGVLAGALRARHDAGGDPATEESGATAAGRDDEGDDDEG